MLNTPDAVVDLLKELVSIESPSYDTAASTHIATRIADILAPLGASVSLTDTDAGTNIVADISGVGDPLLLVGHTDTVWPVGTITSQLPWDHTDDIIRGPGVYDMKAGIVTMLTALSRVAGTTHRATRIILVCDEEVGSPTTRDLLSNALTGVSGAIGFESPHPSGALKVGRRGSTRARLTVTGRSAHAALDPELGVSAIDELVDQLIRVRAVTSDQDLPNPVLCNVGSITGGARTNVVADSASAELGLRFIDPASEHTVMQALSSLTPLRAGAGLELSILSQRPAWLASASDKALHTLAREAAERIGQGLEGYPAAGAGDTNQVGSLGIPTIDGFGPRGGGAHALNEHVRVSSLFERIDLLCSLLAR